MIRQYLSNKNENATVVKSEIFSELNKSLLSPTMAGRQAARVTKRSRAPWWRHHARARKQRVSRRGGRGSVRTPEPEPLQKWKRRKREKWQPEAACIAAGRRQASELGILCAATVTGAASHRGWRDRLTRNRCSLDCHRDRVTWRARSGSARTWRAVSVCMHACMSELNRCWYFFSGRGNWVDVDERWKRNCIWVLFRYCLDWRWKFFCVTSDMSEGCQERFLETNKKTNYITRPETERRIY